MNEVIEKWLNSNVLNEQFIEDLKSGDNKYSQLFEGEIEFGTGGMRGLIGAGPNGINEVTLGRVAAGLADYCVNKYSQPSIIIGYDNRRYSKRFSDIVAQLLSSKGITAYVFSTMVPTPIVSYAVRKIGASAGVMITASHNPGKYNGVKIYDETGCQLLPEKIFELKKYITKYMDEYSFEVDSSSVNYVTDNIIKDYIDEFSHYISKDNKEISIGYSPQHGTGKVIVKQLLENYNFNDVSYVLEQWEEDPDFTNTLSPNPEDPIAFELLIKYGIRENLDILLTTDPDADRLGAYYRDRNGSYQRLSGNQIGTIILSYLIENNLDNKKNTTAYIIKTIVTSNLGKVIAEKNGIEVVDVLTGFKYIGDKINELGDKNFLFAYEESFGYLYNPIVRDKDGLQILLLLCEISNKLKIEKINLGEYLEEIYKKYGYYEENLLFIDISEVGGSVYVEQYIETIKNEFKNGAEITEDFNSQTRVFKPTEKTERLNFPKENVTKFYYENGDWICVRPSGTEPKLKIYYGTVCSNKNEVEIKNSLLESKVCKVINESKKKLGGQKNESSII